MDPYRVCKLLNDSRFQNNILTSSCSFSGRQAWSKVQGDDKAVISLSRSPKEITLFDIVTALEGPVENINFLEKIPHKRTPAREVLKDIWSDLYSNTIQILRSKTIEEFSERHRKLEKEIMYYI